MAWTVDRVVIMEDYIKGEKAPITLYISRNEEFNRMIISDEDGFELMNGSIDFMFKLGDYLTGARDDNETKIERITNEKFQEILDNKP